MPTIASLFSYKNFENTLEALGGKKSGFDKSGELPEWQMKVEYCLLY
jgi:hypothetical protein